MATREDSSHIVVEKKDAPGYRCTECPWENDVDDTDGRDSARRHESQTFGIG